MDFINISASMTMLELVRYLLQDSTNSFSFYSGKLSTCLKNCPSKNSILKETCHYICKKVREEWIVANIGIISVDGELMICVTSPDPSMPAEVICFIVEAVAACTAILTQEPTALSNPLDEASDESMEEDIPPEMIQVNASMKEINERIEQFVRYKRAQANTNNVLEFCGQPTSGDCCARVDAVLERKKDSSSHLAVRNVLDRYTSKSSTERLTTPANQRPFCVPVNASKVQSVNGVLVSQGQQERQPPAAAPVLKGEKRTYDVATLVSMLTEVKKQQKT